MKNRRKHPRINKKLPFKIEDECGQILTETKNISCIGAYCEVSRLIPLMTRLKVHLLLPFEDSRHKRINREVECDGVVVSVEEEKSGSYNIAIFFDRIDEEAKKEIASFVKFFQEKQELQSPSCN